MCSAGRLTLTPAEARCVGPHAASVKSIMVVPTTAGLGRGDPVLAALQACLAPGAQMAGPVDAGSARPGPAGPAGLDLLGAPLHLHRWHLHPEFFVSRPRRIDEVFPWDHLDIGVDKATLRQEAVARGILPSLEG